MTVEFDKIYSRKGTGSVKWDLADGLFGGTDLLPLWVADMDFHSPGPVIEALADVAHKGIFGYPCAMDSYYDAVTGWMMRRFSWAIERDWIVYSPGVVPAINLLLSTFTRPGDGVLVQQPVYYPFMRSIRNNGCRVIDNPLVLHEGRYTMDLDDLARKISRDRVRMAILCSPHNPVGRVWTRHELEGFGNLCVQKGVMVVADEIHCDLVFPGHAHVPFASISDEFCRGSITCTSPSKTFNLAGLQTANLVIPRREWRKEYRITLETLGLQGPNTFGIAACQAAYNAGEEWLGRVMEYMRGNLDYLRDYIATRMPPVRMIEPEGTYLVWCDFRSLGMPPDDLMDRIVRDAHVALDPGTIFGDQGAGFMRINIACPRSILEKAMDSIARALGF